MFFLSALERGRGRDIDEAPDHKHQVRRAKGTTTGPKWRRGCHDGSLAHDILHTKRANSALCARQFRFRAGKVEDDFTTESGLFFVRMPDKKLPAVPETILKRRRRQAENRACRAKATLVARRQRRTKRVEIFKRAEKYVKEYRCKERDEIRLKRDARKDNG